MILRRSPSVFDVHVWLKRPRIVSHVGPYHWKQAAVEEEAEEAEHMNVDPRLIAQLP